MNTENVGVFLLRWFAPLLSAVLSAACAGLPDARENRGALEARPAASIDALRVRVDAARNRRWVLHRDGVDVYEATTQRRIGRVMLPEWMFVRWSFKCTPDLVLDASGAAIVSSNVLPTLWRIDPKRFEATRQELTLDADRDRDVGYTGLAFVNGLLFAVDAMHGSLWKIDLAAAKADKLALSSPLRDACDLAQSQDTAQNRGDRPLALCATGRTGTRRIDLSPDLRQGNVTEGFCR